MPPFPYYLYTRLGTFCPCYTQISECVLVWQKGRTSTILYKLPRGPESSSSQCLLLLPLYTNMCLFRNHLARQYPDSKWSESVCELMIEGKCGGAANTNVLKANKLEMRCGRRSRICGSLQLNRSIPVARVLCNISEEIPCNCHSPCLTSLLPSITVHLTVCFRSQFPESSSQMHQLINTCS